MHHHDQQSAKKGLLSSPIGILTCLSLAAIAAWAIMEHWQHLPAALPYLLFLACPLMHLFMHHGHGKHEHQKDQTNDSENGNR